MIDSSTEPAFCSACGQALRPGSRFCAGCGAAVLRAAAAIPPPAPPPPAAAAPPHQAKKKNRHLGVILTLETILCGGFTVLFVTIGAPPIVLAIFGTAAVLFFIALICLVLARAARRGDQSPP